MSKAKAAVVLSGLMCALLVLSILPVAGANVTFSLLQGAFRRACVDRTTQAPVPPGEPQLFVDACTFVARMLKTLPVSSTPPSRDALDAATLSAAGESRFPCDCDECIGIVSDLEAVIATNGTAAAMVDAFTAACDTKFATDAAAAAQCRQAVADVGVPQAIDYLLANYPPGVLCPVLQACPR